MRLVGFSNLYSVPMKKAREIILPPFTTHKGQLSPSLSLSLSLSEDQPAKDLWISEEKEDMPSIQMKCSCGESNCPEWAIIELQGVIEPRPGFETCLQNLEIGRLCRPSSQETYTFTIGYHELTGSKVALKKPLLVLKKIKHGDQSANSGSSPSRVELDVVGIIRQKILFKTRPKALITSTKKT